MSKYLKRELTIIVPAFNEEKKLRDTILDLIRISDNILEEYEIIIFDDGSSDQTNHIATKLELEFDKVSLVTHDINLGLAASFREGISISKYAYICLIPGDGACSPDSLIPIFGSIGTSELILTNRANQKVARSKLRYLISKSFFYLFKNLFKLNVKDINSLGIYPVERLRNIEIISSNWGFNLEILVKLMRLNTEYKIMDLDLIPEDHIVGSSLNRKFLLDIAKVTGHLLFQKDLSRKD